MTIKITSSMVNVGIEALHASLIPFEQNVLTASDVVKAVISAVLQKPVSVAQGSGNRLGIGRTALLLLPSECKKDKKDGR
jgi:hypothetical protein